MIRIIYLSDCKDLYPVACEEWGKRGECDANPQWMGDNCKKTCDTCDGGEASFGKCDHICTQM